MLAALVGEGKLIMDGTRRQLQNLEQGVNLAGLEQFFSY